MIDNISEVLDGVKTVGIGGHVRPDGDCIGAAAALGIYLKKLCPDAVIEIFLDQLQTEFKGLPGTERIRTNYNPSVSPFDLFFSLDCGKDRLGGAEKFFDAAKRKVNIDHHVSNPGTGEHNYIVPDASSTCELVYSLMDKDLVDAGIAQSIYMGIVHDTGVFQYSNTSSETLRTAAELISYGFDFSALIARTFYEKSYNQNRIMGRALLNARLFLEGRMIGSVLTREEMKEFHIHAGQLDGIVSKLRETRGVDCAVLLYPLDNGENKLSLRSSGETDVARIAEQHGGGGHIRAAGCNMTGEGWECMDIIVSQVKAQLFPGTDSPGDGSSFAPAKGCGAAMRPDGGNALADEKAMEKITASGEEKSADA